MTTPARVRLQCICGQGFEHNCVASWERPNGEYTLTSAPAQSPDRPGIDQLRNLADRAERGPLTPDEAARLRDGIDALVTRTEKAERAVNLLADSHRRAEQTEATLTAFRDQVQAITDEARGGIRQQLGDALAVLDRHGQTPA